MKKVIYVIMPLFLWAGTVGKISGRVIDAETQKSLAKVDVFMPSLGNGTSSDLDGYYFILNVPPGKYEVKASIIGYVPEIKKEVYVSADLTTYLNFELSTTVIEIGRPVVVTAQKPVIEIDITSKEARITRS